MTQPTAGAINVGIRTETIPGPDGKTWVRAQLSFGAAAFTFALPEAATRELAEKLPQALLRAADVAHRQSTGLIVPDAAQLPQLPPSSNGGGPT